MKNSLTFLFLFISTIILSLFLPWWIIAPLALVVSYFLRLSAGSGFVLSFLAVFAAWVLSIYFIDNGVVTDLMGKLFEVEGYLIPMIAGVIGGLIGGVFGWAGALLAPRQK